MIFAAEMKCFFDILTTLYLMFSMGDYTCYLVAVQVVFQTNFHNLAFLSCFLSREIADERLSAMQEKNNPSFFSVE